VPLRLLVPVICLLAVTVRADPLLLDSGDSQVTLLELYTSQGCSSCPPAERWLNALVDSDYLWTGIVPVALHVDYWDYLGWTDPFATAANTQRQRALARDNRTRTIYTPGMFADGREWRGWLRRDAPPARGATPGALTARIENGRVEAKFPAGGRELKLHVAVLGFDIETRVERGENRDRTLPQEFVLLAHTMHDSADGRWEVALPVPGASADRLGIALWVSEPGSPVPLQATGGWLQPRD
jgi:hypothetical protein